MSDPAILAVMSAPDLSVQALAYARKMGQPSDTEEDRVEVLLCDAGRTRVGISTAGMTQSAFFAENEGAIGDGSDPNTVYAEVYTPIGAPLASKPYPPSTDSEIDQSVYWSFGATIPPGFASGAKLTVELDLRLLANNLTARPYRDDLVSPDGIPDTQNWVDLFIVLDPYGTPLVVTGAITEESRTPPKPARLGWTPLVKFGLVAIEEGGGSNPGNAGELCLHYNAHGLVNGNEYHVATNDALDMISTLEPGQRYFVGAKTVNKWIVYEDFDLTTPVVYEAPVPNSTSANVIVSRPASGSRHKIKFWFRIAAAQQISDYRSGKLVIEMIAEGRGSADTEDGVLYRCTLSAHKSALLVGNLQPVVGTVGDYLEWRQDVLMTGPGRSMSLGNDTSAPLAQTAAPLIFAKRDYYTDSATWNVTGVVAEDGAGSLTHPTFTACNALDAFTVTNAGGTTITVGTHYVKTRNRSSFVFSATPGGVAETFVGDSSTVQCTMGPAHFDAFYPTWWDYGGGYDIVHLDNRLFADPSNTTGEILYPLASVQGNDVSGYAGANQNSTQFRTATASFVKVAGVVLGEIVYHDNLRGVIFVKPMNDGKHVKYGDVLTIDTYLNKKASGTGNFAMEATPTQTLTTFLDTTPIVARTVALGPQATNLGIRAAVSGPPNGDVEIDIRRRAAFLTRHLSR